MMPKFRGFRIKTEEWVEGNLIYREEPYLHDIVIPIGDSSTISYAVERDSIGQWTGLKDKSGKEIYNHQKVLVDSPKGAFEAKVVFEHGGFGIVATKGHVCDYFEASWIDDFVPFVDLYVIENCEEGTLWMVEVAE